MCLLCYFCSVYVWLCDCSGIQDNVTRHVYIDTKGDGEEGKAKEQSEGRNGMHYQLQFI